jgi:hypothetical protein
MTLMDEIDPGGGTMSEWAETVRRAYEAEDPYCPACSTPFEYLCIGTNPDDGVWYECEECGWGERWGPGPETAKILAEEER